MRTKIRFHSYNFEFHEKHQKVDDSCTFFLASTIIAHLSVIEYLSSDVKRKGKLSMSCQKQCTTHPSGQDSCQKTFDSNGSDINHACYVHAFIYGYPTWLFAYKRPNVLEAGVDWQPTQQHAGFLLPHSSWLLLPLCCCCLSRWRIIKRERNWQKLEASQNCWWRTVKRGGDCEDQAC